MAKTSMINREQKRRRAVQKYATRRAELKTLISNSSAGDEERREAQRKLQGLPRDASPTRLRNRCRLTGARAGITASSDWGAISCARLPCAAISRA